MRAAHEDEDSEMPLGIVFDRSMNLVGSMVRQGSLDDNGLVVSGSDKMFLLKTLNGGLNDVNAAWVDKAAWDANVREVKGVG